MTFNQQKKSKVALFLKSCSEKESTLTSSQKIDLRPYINFFTNVTYRCELRVDTLSGEVSTIACDDWRSFTSVRARYWFFVISRCNPTNEDIKV